MTYSLSIDYLWISYYKPFYKQFKIEIRLHENKTLLWNPTNSLLFGNSEIRLSTL